MKLDALCRQGLAELCTSLRRHYPYVRAPTETHRAYVRLLLSLCETHPLLEPVVLQLVMERFLEVDVEVERPAPPRSEKPHRSTGEGLSRLGRKPPTPLASECADDLFA